MDSRNYVLKETAVVAVGEVICTALMVAVFAILGKFDLTVLWGGLAGCLITVGNFFFLAIVASLASDRAINQDVEGAKKMVKSSQSIRFLAVGVLLFLCALSKKCDLIALVLPLLFQRPILLVAEFFRKKGA